MKVLLLFLASVYCREYQIRLQSRVEPAFLHYHGISRSRDNRTFAGDAGLLALHQWGVRFTVLPAQKGERSYGYTDQHQLEGQLKALARDYPHLAQTFTLGKSVLGKDIWGIRISNLQKNNLPQVNFGGNHHGDEIVSRQLLLSLAQELVQSYSTNDRIRRIVDSTDIYLVPCFNPDGFEMGRRTNANGYDLNRNFPDRFFGAPRRFEPETEAMMRWNLRNRFVLSVSGHGGDLVVNLPWNNNREHRSGLYTPTPDEAVLKDLAKTFSFAHHKMHASSEFPGGITNGCDWYVIVGCYQDFLYVNTSTLPLTIELSYPKSPPASTLPSYWSDSRPAFLALLERVHGPSIYGQTKPNGYVYIQEIDRPVQANAAGYYWRLLTEGVWHASKDQKTWTRVVVKDKAIRLNLLL